MKEINGVNGVNEKRYYTLDNRDASFKVIFNLTNKTFKVFCLNNNQQEENVIEGNYVEYKLGMSTEAWADVKGCEGNSILIITNINNSVYDYIFIGAEVIKFSGPKMIKFESTVGNNGVPYPYLMDENNDYYILLTDYGSINISKITIHGIVDGTKKNNVYSIYYKHKKVPYFLDYIPCTSIHKEPSGDYGMWFYMD